jgi:hypothetical protein
MQAVRSFIQIRGVVLSVSLVDGRLPWGPQSTSSAAPQLDGGEPSTSTCMFTCHSTAELGLGAPDLG